MTDHTGYGRARIDDRQINELIGLARGLLADGVLADSEIEYLQKWLAASEVVVDNPVIAILLDRVTTILEDATVDEDERADLIKTLSDLAGGNFELGETLKASSLPLCDPVPIIEFPGYRFTFTGTFAYGSRRECEDAITQLAGMAGSLTRTTRFLVIGDYATDSWAHSAFGRKIEKAVEMRDQGLPISIVSESDWRASLDAELAADGLV